MFCRLLLLIVLVGCAAANAAPLGEVDARFLLTRTGFSPIEAEVLRLASMDRTQAVAQLVDAATTPAKKPVPAWLNEPLIKPAALRNASVDERRDYLQLDSRRNFDTKAWWIDQMIATPTPLAERMTLFFR